MLRLSSSSHRHSPVLLAAALLLAVPGALTLSSCGSSCPATDTAQQCANIQASENAAIISANEGIGENSSSSQGAGLGLANAPGARASTPIPMITDCEMQLHKPAVSKGEILAVANLYCKAGTPLVSGSATVVLSWRLNSGHQWKEIARKTLESVAGSTVLTFGLNPLVYVPCKAGDYRDDASGSVTGPDNTAPTTADSGYLYGVLASDC